MFGLADGFRGLSRPTAICFTALLMLVQAGCANTEKQAKSVSENVGQDGLTCTTAGECAPVPAATAFGKLIASAVYNSPEVAAARADLRRANAELKVARGGYYPSLGVQSETDNNDETLEVSVRQPIWRGGRVKAGVQKAEANVKAAQSKLIISQVEAALSFIDAYSAWMLAQYTVEAIDESLVDHRAIVDQVERRLESGVGADSEVSLVEARLGSTEADRLSGEASKEIARAKLTSQLGRMISDAELRSVVALPAASFSLSDQSLTNAVAASPYVALTGAEIDKAKAAIAVAEAERFPDLTLNASNEVTGLLSGGTISATRVFLGAASAIGPGKALKHQIAVARAELDALVAARDARMRSVRNEIGAQFLQYEASKSRVASTAVAVDASEKVLTSYRSVIGSSGGKGWQDILSAARELSEARRSNAESRAQHFASYWKLRLAVSGLLGL